MVDAAMVDEKRTSKRWWMLQWWMRKGPLKDGGLCNGIYCHQRRKDAHELLNAVMEHRYIYHYQSQKEADQL